MLFSFVSNTILDTIYNTIKETIVNIVTPPQAGNEAKNIIKHNNKITLMEEGKANELNEPLIGNDE
jgi:hypothetical protein